MDAKVEACCCERGGSVEVEVRWGAPTVAGVTSTETGMLWETGGKKFIDTHTKWGEKSVTSPPHTHTHTHIHLYLSFT